MLSDRDLFLMSILEKVTLANTRQLMILGGYRDPSVIRKRINKLKSQGYIESGWIGDHLGYTLSQSGLYELEKNRKPYEIKGIKSEHEELVTQAACWIYIRSQRSIMEMFFDHELNSKAQFKGTGHKPDIVFSKHQALEVELNSKSTASYGNKSRLEENFKMNANNYGRQTWVIPKRKEGLRKRLMELSQKYNVEKYFTVISVEDLISQVNEYDASTNYPRTEPVIAVPAPIIREKKEVWKELK